MVRWHVAFRTSHVHQTTRNNDQITDDYNWPIRHGNGPRWSVSDLKKNNKTKERMKVEKKVGKSEDRGREGKGNK